MFLGYKRIPVFFILKIIAQNVSGSIEFVGG